MDAHVRQLIGDRFKADDSVFVILHRLDQYAVFIIHPEGEFPPCHLPARKDLDRLEGSRRQGNLCIHKRYFRGLDPRGSRKRRAARRHLSAVRRSAGGKALDGFGAFKGSGGGDAGRRTDRRNPRGIDRAGIIRFCTVTTPFWKQVSYSERNQINGKEND